MQDELIQQSEFLNSTWGNAVVWFGALWAILWFIRKVSKDADDDLNPETREALSDELLRIKDRDASLWVPDFTLVFDRFFGKKHFSWQCIFRSALVSIFAFITLAFLFDVPELLGQESDSKYELFIELLIFAILVNVVLDYMSLLETRYILSKRMPVLEKIIMDAIITILLVIIWTAFVNTLIQATHFTVKSYIEGVALILEDIFAGSREGSIITLIILATSFTTSIWLWLHGLSRILIRSLSNVQKFMGWLNVKETPLRAIGTTINLIVLTFGVLLFPVYLFY